jgi:hypothetical protein
LKNKTQTHTCKGDNNKAFTSHGPPQSLTFGHGGHVMAVEQPQIVGGTAHLVGIARTWARSLTLLSNHPLWLAILTLLIYIPLCPPLPVMWGVPAATQPFVWIRLILLYSDSPAIWCPNQPNPMFLVFPGLRILLFSHMTLFVTTLYIPVLERGMYNTDPYI